MTIYSYTKYVDATVARELQLPFDSVTGKFSGSELTTVNGVTYVSLPDEVDLPSEQPQEIAASIKVVILTDDLREVIKKNSPHVRLINSRVQSKISERYSISDEVKLIRTAPSQEYDAYNEYVEECRAWGREEKAKLGL